ncbi:L-threonine aldolase [Lacinutrix venerupis]|uniref:threonine aldolase family protein n=1 Tax=Lacinutrix venerupis TaxID=1486034 RepID=UPI000EB17FB9|nr:GntG family PLP-dependent aldolase [Lacinutrix venerupis]RLJ68778.1 L-threonine aldolase [Lacinutrix venerupis]
MKIDLRSDTLTKPSKGMLEAMMQAKVGDDVYKEDETVNKLEERVAKLFGKSHALFFPSGTMANQAAIKLHTNPGDQVICDKYAHIFNYEGGGVSFNSGVSCKLLDGERGMFTAKQVEAAINPPDFYHSPLTTLVAVENTTNKGGGACWDLEELKRIKKVCETNNLGYHLDGARLWNAMVEKNETAKQYGEIFNTISVCFSKGLGCPVGSVLVGDKKLMERAIRIRKIFGGGMRQVGFLAAAGLYALDNNINLLKEDHKKAKEIALVLNKVNYVDKVEKVETNIVIFTLNNRFSDDIFLETLKSKNVFISNMGQGKLRIVTHLDYNLKMHESLLNILLNL